MTNDTLPDGIYQKPVHEALIELIDDAAIHCSDHILHLLEIIPHFQIESGFSEISNALWSLNEASKGIFAETIENTINSVTVMKLKAESRAICNAAQIDETVKKPLRLLDTMKKIMVGTTSTDDLAELRFLAGKMNILLMHPKPSVETWVKMVESGIEEIEDLFQRIRLKDSLM
jgi:hypothetical protein